MVTRCVVQLARSAVLSGWLVLGVHAQMIVKEYRFEGVNRAIPDGDLTGVTDVREVSGLASLVVSAVQVNLVISPISGSGFTGDLYVALWHLERMAVLLNRPGRTADNPFGYDDSGELDITLVAEGAPDVHLYRENLGGAQVPLPGPLTGIWMADARARDPVHVLDTDARTMGLDVFAGSDPNGIWALYLVDASAGAAMQLDRWSLSLLLVPEPQAGPMVTGGLLLAGWLLYRRIGRRKHCPQAAARRRAGLGGVD